MVEGKLDSQWNHTCSIVSSLYNVNRGKGRPMSPDDIHPMRLAEKKIKEESVKHPIDILKCFLPKSEQKRLKRKASS